MMEQALLGKLRAILGPATPPQAMARLLAHRYGIQWHLVESLSEDLTREFGYTLQRAAREIGEPSEYVEPLYPWLDGIDEMFAVCESPIEEIFLAAFSDPEFAFSWESSFIYNHPDSDGCLPNRIGTTEYGPLAIQHKIGKYRVDFAMTPAPSKWLAIELDGHDFHERTKEQAQRDKSRDREIQAAGWHVVRFTGSEVWKSPTKCVRETLAIAASMRGAR